MRQEARGLRVQRRLRVQCKLRMQRRLRIRNKETDLRKSNKRGVAQLVARLLWERAVVFGCGFQKSEQSSEKRRKREEIASSGCRKNWSDHRFDHS